MNITTKDIKKRDFKKSIRGYDMNEVDAFLDMVSSHYEKLVVENKTLAEKIKGLMADIEVYKENESNLQRAIIKSQDIAEEVIKNAKRQAEIILKEAELDSRKLRQDIDDEILNRKQELEGIKLRNEKIIEDLKIFLSEKINDVDDFTRNKNVLKMELTSVSDFHEINAEKKSEEDTPSGNFELGEKTQEEKSVKKVLISESYDSEKKKFDDNFEAK